MAIIDALKGKVQTMAKMTLEQAKMAQLTDAQIKLLTEQGVIGEVKAEGPVAYLQGYVNKGGEPSTQLVISKNGDSWGAAMIRLNSGLTLTDEGKAMLVKLANCVGDLLDGRELPVKAPVVKKAKAG